MAAIAEVDARRFRIPDSLNAAAFVTGCANAWMLADEAGPASLGEALVRAAAAALLFFGLRWFYERRRGVEAIGLGDVKLAAVAGLWLGPIPLAVAIELAAVTALAGAVLRGRRRGRQLGRHGRVPFGAFFAPAVWAAWLLQSVTGW